MNSMNVKVALFVVLLAPLAGCAISQKQGDVGGAGSPGLLIAGQDTSREGRPTVERTAFRAEPRDDVDFGHRPAPQMHEALVCSRCR